MPKPLACQQLSDNHSADTIEVYHGTTTPLTLCGYHYENQLQYLISTIESKEPN